MIIDGHAHAARDYSTGESVLQTAQKFQIEKVVLCTSVKNNLELRDPPNIPGMNTPDSIYILNRMLRFTYRHFIEDKGDGNNYVFELRKRLPRLIVQFLWINPLDAEQMTSIEKNIRDYQVKGIKLHQAWNPFSIDSREFSRLVEVARAYNLPVFIHLYSKRETWKLLQFIGKHRDVVFIIGHLLGLSIFKEQTKSLGNVYFDTSGSNRIRPTDIQEAVTSFGYEHVIFGSDMPFARIAAQIQKIEGLNLSDNAKEHIFRQNIRNLLSLDD